MDIRKITKLGRTFNVRERSDLFWRNVSRNKWENRTFRIFRQFIRREETYLDIGAWIGPTVLFGAGAARHCYAVEPDPVAFEELKANLALNPGLAANVTLFNGCIAAATGRVRFGSQTSFGDSQSSLLFSDKGKALEVEGLGFDDFVRRYNIRDCGFIKMDIEGGESVVLPTMKAFLAQQMPALYLSLHQKWFRDRAADVRAIARVLDVYPYIYESDGTLLKKEGLERHLMSCDVAEVVCLQKPWPFWGRLYHQALGA